jgi:hypothetical protein
LVALRRKVHRALVPVALLAYSLPLVVGLLTDIGHGARHLGETMREQKERAVSTGLVHASFGATSEAESGPVLHTHGGSTHAHSSWLGALLRATDDVDPTDPGMGETPTLALHLYPSSSFTLFRPTLRTPGERAVRPHTAASESAPLHPPPRV